MSEDYDVIVIGGGVVGLATALSLCDQNLGVLVIDKGEPGREASWAGGGILSPIHPHHYPTALAELCQRSAEIYPSFVSWVEAEAGFSVELRSTGLLRLAIEEDPDFEEVEAFITARGARVDRLSGERARELEPGLAPQFREALYEPAIQQVRNPRLLKALKAACVSRGVTVRSHSPCEGLIVESSQVKGVRVFGERITARDTVLAAGAWSGRLLSTSLGFELPVAPVHGVMLLMESQPALIKSVLLHEGCYLIPRADGHIVIGSTLEQRGFDKRVLLGSVNEVLAGALQILPALGGCSWKQAWAGLRPGTPDRLPYIGRPAGIEGFVLATGHYRNGLLLAPATAEIITAVICGEDAPCDLAPFSVERVAATSRPKS